MNSSLDTLRTMLSILLVSLSFVTAIAASMRASNKKNEFTHFLCDLVAMLVGSFVALGTFGIILQLLYVKVQSYVGFYKLVTLNEDKNTNHLSVVRFTWTGIVGNFLAFISEVTRFIPY